MVENLPVIGVHGKKRHGKDTIGAFVSAFSSNKKQYAFAGPVKEATSAIFGLPLSAMYEGDREKQDPFWELSPRVMMQMVGTDCSRNVIRNDIWLKRAEQELEKETLHTELDDMSAFVVTDVRFDNEAAWVRDRGEVWHVIRPRLLTPDNVDAHASEAGILEGPNDVIFINDGSITELLGLVRHHLENCHGWNISSVEFDEYCKMVDK